MTNTLTSANKNFLENTFGLDADTLTAFGLTTDSDSSLVGSLFNFPPASSSTITNTFNNVAAAADDVVEGTSLMIMSDDQSVLPDATTALLHSLFGADASVSHLDMTFGLNADLIGVLF